MYFIGFQLIMSEPVEIILHISMVTMERMSIELGRVDMLMGASNAHYPVPSLPTWLKALVERKNGSNVQFLLEKRLSNTDTNVNARRLVVSKESTENYILPMLLEAEVRAVETQRTGLEVLLYNQGGWKFSASFICQSRCTYMIYGKEWPMLVSLNEFKSADIFQMWGFRVKEGNSTRLCLAIAKKNQ